MSKITVFVFYSPKTEAFRLKRNPGIMYVIPSSQTTFVITLMLVRENIVNQLDELSNRSKFRQYVLDHLFIVRVEQVYVLQNFFYKLVIRLCKL